MICEISNGLWVGLIQFKLITARSIRKIVLFQTKHEIFSPLKEGDQTRDKNSSL